MIKIIDLSIDKTKGLESIEATFMVDGGLIPLRVAEEDRPEVFSKVKQLITNSDVDYDVVGIELYKLMSPAAAVKSVIDSSYHLSGNMSIENGILKFGEHFLENTLSTHMLALLDNTTNTPKDEKTWKAYVRFLDNLFQNVNPEIREQLFRWMDYENRAGFGFGITEDGCIVGYKGCGGTILNPHSINTGEAIVDGEEISGHIPNNLGSVISMPRSSVQFDPSIGCSYGLHVGTRDYAIGWGPILLLVKVNPRDVVSVPFECSSQKMRVCEYTVLKVTDASEEHKMIHFNENDEDYDCDDCDCDDYDCDCDECCECDCEDCIDGTENFEVTLTQAKELLGLKVFVEYEDKDFMGVVIEVYEDNANSGIIIKSPDAYKHIKLSRIDYCEVIEDDDEDFEETDDGLENIIDPALLELKAKLKEIFNTIDEDEEVIGIQVDKETENIETHIRNILGVLTGLNPEEIKIQEL